MTSLVCALRNVARPAISSSALPFCHTARFTGRPCADCVRIAAGMTHTFLSALPTLRYLPSEIDGAVKALKQNSPSRAGVIKAAALLCDAVSDDGMPCRECQRIAAIVVHRFLEELPESRFLPSELDRAIRINCGDA
jgi:hypothetical protein